NASALHLEFKVRNNVQAVRRVQDLLQGAGVQTIADGQVRAQLKNDKSQAQFLVYAENLKAEDLQALFRELGVTESQARKALSDTVALSSLPSEDRQTVARLTGLAPHDLQAPQRGDPAPKKKNDETAPSQFTPPERFALILANTGGPGDVSP